MRKTCQLLQKFSPLKQRKVDEIIRVDHAGEVAAVRIAANQLFFMSPLDDSVPIVKEILDEEIVHRRVMNELAEKHEVRKTVMDPFFKFGAFAMGAGTALMGKDAMMCCHAAVEITIFNHYNEQLREMEMFDEKINDANETEAEKKDWDTIKDYVAKFRDEEKHHQELGENNGAENAPLYPLLYNGIQAACKLGVAIAKRF